MVEIGLAVRIRARRECVAPVRELLAVYVRELGVEAQVSFELQLAVQEALTNVVRHAYAGRDAGALSLEAGVEDRDIVVRIADTGEPFDPTAQPDPDVGGARSSGYGLFLIRQIVDRIDYERQGDRNLLTLRRSLARARQPVDKRPAPG